MDYNIGSNVKGVYLIRNKINGKCYIGSSVCIRRRIAQHFRSLKQNSHHSADLQIDFNKYGIENFQVEVLLECSVSDARKYEEEYITKFNLKEFGYNQGNSKEALKKKDGLFKDRLFDLLKELGYKSDGKLYWFNIFKISKLLKTDITSLLSKFGINKCDSWNSTIIMGNGDYIALNFDGDEGVQITAFHKSYFELNWQNQESVYVDMPY